MRDATTCEDERVSVTITYQAREGKARARLIVHPEIRNFDITPEWANLVLSLRLNIPCSDKYTKYAYRVMRKRYCKWIWFTRMELHETAPVMSKPHVLPQIIEVMKPHVAGVDINYKTYVISCSDREFLYNVFKDLVAALKANWDKIRLALLLQRPDHQSTHFQREMLWPQKRAFSGRQIVTGEE